MSREKFLNVCGYFLFAFWIVFTVVQFHLGKFTGPLWFCNISVALLAIACFQRSLSMIYFFLATGLFFQTPWIIDWMIYFFTGFSFFNLNQLYAGEPFYSMILTFIRHILTVPLVFILLFFFKPKKPPRKVVASWIVFIFVIIALSYFIGGNRNINCAKAFCSDAFGIITGPYYYFGWPLFISVVFLLSLYFVVIPIHKFISKIRFE